MSVLSHARTVCLWWRSLAWVSSAVALTALVLAATPLNAVAAISPATKDCLGCHSSIHPGIVEGWKRSRHATVSPAVAMQKKRDERRMSADTVPEAIRGFEVGCAECHTIRPQAHGKGTFDHNGFQVHTVVSSADCATCHSVEQAQFQKNIMANAYAILAENPLYNQLEAAVGGRAEMGAGGVVSYPLPDQQTRNESCYSCHGTKLSVAGTDSRDTAQGPMDFPRITGWPSTGVGRINLDGSLGSCSACHTRHEFSISHARSPAACEQCHVGPDVPAYKVYVSSRHGNIYETRKGNWNMEAVPWQAGRDFTAPTCATCHISMVTDGDGAVLSQRTHQMNDRLPWRIFGSIYAHPHPISPELYKMRAPDGLPLPVSLDGRLATQFLISKEEQGKRKDTMLRTCSACHAASWSDGVWQRLENTIQVTNHTVRVATQVMEQAWQKGLAQGLPQKKNPFDEYPERVWSDLWLFYANSTRFASAMGGGGDYGVFAGGRYQLSRGVAELDDWVKRNAPKKN